MIAISDGFKIRLEKGVTALLPALGEARVEKAQLLLSELQANGGLEEDELTELMCLLQSARAERTEADADREASAAGDADAPEKPEAPSDRRVEEQFTRVLQLLAVIRRRRELDRQQNPLNRIKFGRR